MHTALLVIQILGSVSLFLYGMKVMSEGVQRFAGTRLQEYLNRMTRNPYSGAFAGTVFTAALQSSSLVSVLTLSFVNAGLLNLRKAFSVIVGANVGTTIKMWIIIGLGLAWHVERLAFPLIIIATVFYFFQNPKWKDAAHFLMGLAMIFLGFYFLNEFLPDLSAIQSIHNLLNQYTGNSSVWNSLFFVIIGIVVTFLFHSSSAFTIFAAVLVLKGIPLDQAAMMVIGANIGTTSTALIASLVANKQAKIVAWFHFFFNLFGAFLFFFFVPSIIQFIKNYVSTDGEIILISFHTIFNVVSAVLILPFVNGIADWTSQKFLQNEPNKVNLKLIGKPFAQTAQMYVMEGKRELVRYAGITRQVYNQIGKTISESDDGKFEILLQRISELNDEAKEINYAISDYLQKIYLQEMTGDMAKNIHSMQIVCDGLKKVNNSCVQLAKIQRYRRERGSFITPKLRTHLIEIHDAISVGLSHFVQNLYEIQNKVNQHELNSNQVSIENAIEHAKDDLHKAMEKEKINRISSFYYRDLMNEYEKIGEYLQNANQTIVS